MPTLTEAEQSQLNEWNNTSLLVDDVCIHQLFERQVLKTPNNIAICFGRSELTYQELNERANQVANHLLELGVKAETLVGICIERSLDMVIGILGVLKAGGAYVPMDPNYPEERLQFIMDDTNSPILITQNSLADNLPQKAQIVCLDKHWDIISKLKADNLNNQADNKRLAYVIYTSGSTGKPKGVAIEHHSAVVLIAWAKEIFTPSELSGVLAATSICFDLSIFELFVPLSWGHKIILVEDALALTKLNDDAGVTLLNTVPSAIRELVRVSGIPKSVKVINLAGEPLGRQLVKAIHDKCRVNKVYNLYGPSEDTTYSTFALIDQVSDDPPVIGCPVANTKAYVLDDKRQLVPIGDEGELYLGGDGLARYYLNRPDLTAEKFIPNPFSDDSNSRLYQTGDMVRYRSDGNLEYIGRIDNQVKIRGFRVELGEIEAAINQCPSAQEAVVLAREDDLGTKHLVLYIVSNMIPQRISLNGTCLVEFADDPLIKLTTKDISCEGVRLVGVPDHWQAGNLLRLVLQLPGSYEEEPFVEGRIAWSEGQEAGVQFSMASASQGKICKNIKELIDQVNFGNVEIALTDEDFRADNVKPQFKLKRLPIRSVCYAEYGDGSVVELRTEHIDCDSVRLIGVPDDWRPGMRVCIHLQLPNIPDDLLLDGVVTWHEGKHAAVDFDESAQTKAQISNTLNRMFSNHHVMDAIQRSSAAAQHFRKYLQRKLPVHMVPANIVFLSEMPLTPNGKIDRKALLSPDHGRPELIEEDFEVAHTETEETVADIWALVLEMDQVSVLDGFFDLGGTSLSAARVINRIREVFQMELPLHALFEWPTISELSVHIDSYLSVDHPDIVPLEAIANKTNIPLSFSQQQLWLHAQMSPDVPVYNEPFTFRLGAANLYILEQSFNELLKRHEAMRTWFSTVNGEPIQIVNEFVPYQFTRLDLRQCPESEKEEKALEYATKEAKKPFDLAVYPLFRATFVHISDSDTRLYITFHHIIMDGVSIYNVFLPELAIHYRVFSIGEQSPLPPFNIQYTDFAIWQRKWLECNALEDQWRYWEQQLAGLTPLQLPTDRPHPPITSFNGARHCFSFSRRLSADLKKFSQHEGVTLFVTLLTGFKALLHRYSGQDDIVVGTVTAGRQHSELELMMGDFLDTLVLRTRFSNTLPTEQAEQLTFKQLLHRVRDVVVGAFSHQDIPFEQLATKLYKSTIPGENPFFQVLFDLDPAITPLDYDWELDQFDVQTHTAKFDIMIEMDERENGIIGRLEYNTDLFDESTIIRMVDHYKNLLYSIADPDQLVSHTPILTKDEQNLFIKQNNTESIFPSECVHQLFEQQVKRTPESTAILFEGDKLSYATLNLRANQLAHYLIKLGVKPDTMVGICVNRSLEMVVGLLAILKSGCAYIPLDPTYPKDRVAYIVNDAKAPVLLTQESLVPTLPKMAAKLVRLDTDWEQISKYDSKNPIPNICQQSLAYVIYTSGSTGKPKGVMVPHRSTVNFLFGMQKILKLNQRDAILGLTTVAFDIAVLEIYLPLILGAKIVLVSREEARDGRQLWQTIRHHNVSTIQATPASWRVLLATTGEDTPELNTILCGGEALPDDLASQLMNRGKHVWNVYGPTETTVWSMVSPVKNVETKLISTETVEPIGYPIANTEIHILDKNLQPVPIGISGELHIGGEGLTRGYVNRPELTIKTFIPNPFNNGSKRLYKTGDLAKYRADGNVEYLGRIDFQVKIRGYRIELGEIESVLSQYQYIQECAVIVREDVPGDKRLVAYFVAKAEGESDVDYKTLRQFMQKKLPDYMVPAIFSPIVALPLTPNGKIDRKAFPQPEANRSETTTSYREPQNETENKILSVFQEVLHIDKIGVNDNFFDLGGNSLLLIQVSEKLSSILDCDVPVLAVLQYSTVNMLADHLTPSEKNQTQIQDQDQQSRASKQKEARKGRSKKRRRT